MKTRKPLSLIICIAMVLTLLPANIAFAENTTNVYVGNVVLDVGHMYAKTDATTGTVTTDGASEDDYNVKFDDNTANPYIKQCKYYNALFI